MIQCSATAVGFIIRPDGYRCALCRRHQSYDWDDAPADHVGYTLGMYPLSDRYGQCQRMVSDVELMRPTKPTSAA